MTPETSPGIRVPHVANGYAQQPGIDFTKTAAPTVCLESLRSILHLAASLQWNIQHFDIKTAFLHGVLTEDETAYMEQPPGFEAPGKKEWVMRLMKSIYGMRQAGCRWNQTLHKAVSEWGFTRVFCDWCVYIHRTPNGTVIFAVHVDDIFSIADPPKENAQFRDQLKSVWDISDLGPAKFALGLKPLLSTVSSHSLAKPTHTPPTPQWSPDSNYADQISRAPPHPRSLTGSPRHHTANLWEP